MDPTAATSAARSSSPLPSTLTPAKRRGEDLPAESEQRAADPTPFRSPLAVATSSPVQDTSSSSSSSSSSFPFDTSSSRSPFFDPRQASSQQPAAPASPSPLSPPSPARTAPVDPQKLLAGIHAHMSLCVAQSPSMTLVPFDGVLDEEQLAAGESKVTTGLTDRRLVLLICSYALFNFDVQKQTLNAAFDSLLTRGNYTATMKIVMDSKTRERHLFDLIMPMLCVQHFVGHAAAAAPAAAAAAADEVQSQEEAGANDDEKERTDALDALGRYHSGHERKIVNSLRLVMCYLRHSVALMDFLRQPYPIGALYDYCSLDKILTQPNKFNILVNEIQRRRAAKPQLSREDMKAGLHTVGFVNERLREHDAEDAAQQQQQQQSQPQHPQPQQQQPPHPQTGFSLPRLDPADPALAEPTQGTQRWRMGEDGNWQQVRWAVQHRQELRLYVEHIWASPQHADDTLIQVPWSDGSLTVGALKDLHLTPSTLKHVLENTFKEEQKRLARNAAQKAAMEQQLKEKDAEIARLGSA